MGIGYTVGALHTITYIEDSVDPYPVGKDSFFFESITKAVNYPGNGRVNKLHLSKSTVQEITIWRQDMDAKYKEQLQEPLMWNEDSSFIETEDLPSRLVSLLNYSAAVIDNENPDEAKRLLNDTALIRNGGFKFRSEHPLADRMG